MERVSKEKQNKAKQNKKKNIHDKIVAHSIGKLLHLAPVVQTLDSAIHRINHYPPDKSLSNG